MIKPKIETKEIGGEKKLDSLKKLLHTYGNSYVTVGFHEDAGQYKDGTSVVKVAMFNEFGTESSPSRPFFSRALEQNKAQIDRWVEGMMDDCINKGTPPQVAFDRLGFKVKTIIQNQISSNMPPPNAPSTKDQKKRDGVPPVTLIHTGLMLRSVAWKTTVVITA